MARSAREHSDRSISMAAISALGGLLREYAPLRARAAGELVRDRGRRSLLDPDFVSMAPAAVAEIREQRIWLETKVLRQYLALFGESLGEARDVANLIALETRRLGVESIDIHPNLLELVIRFFNSYLRAAVNARDLRTAYYVLDQYRLLGEATLAARDTRRTLEIAGHLRFYGQLAYEMEQPFLLEAVAYDLARLVERAVETGAARGRAAARPVPPGGPRARVAGAGGAPARRAPRAGAARDLLPGGRRRAAGAAHLRGHEATSGRERLAAVRDELMTRGARAVLGVHRPRRELLVPAARAARAPGALLLLVPALARAAARRVRARLRRRPRPTAPGPVADWPALRRRRRRPALVAAHADHARQRGRARDRVDPPLGRRARWHARRSARARSRSRPSWWTARSTPARRAAACSRSTPRPGASAGATTPASTPRSSTS